MRSRVGLEAELVAAEKVRTRHRRAPVSLDVLDDQIGTGEVADERRFRGVIHRVGHVANEHDIQPLLRQLANRERPAEHAHVRVNAHDRDVLDAALLHEVIRLRRIGNRVAVDDLERVVLVAPGAIVLDRLFATAVGIVDRQRRFLLRVEFAPAFERHLRFDFRRAHRKFAAGVIFVKLHRVAGAMDDERAFLAGGGDQFVHSRGQLADPCRGTRAPMFVPHIANDDRRLLRVPVRRLHLNVIPPRRRFGLRAATRMERERLRHLGNQRPGKHRSQQ